MSARISACCIALLVAFSSWASAQEVPRECGHMVRVTGAPQYKNEPPEQEYLCRDGYLLSHNAERKTPDWVLERLTPDRFVGPGDRKAHGTFRADDQLPEDKRAEPSDYRGSGFDRGHMAPAADMKFSENAMKQSFLLSNMAPQVGAGLNRAIWADLEGIARDWACERKELIVITGPIYESDSRIKTMGTNKVAIPTAFYKIVYLPSQRRAIAFILPNKAVDKKGLKSWEALKKFIVSLEHVEEKTGLALLPNLPKREQSRLGSLKSVMWPVKQKCAVNTGA